MDWNTVFFMLFPYAAIALAIVVTAARITYRPFSVSSLSSQLLERKKLYWGSIPFHYGIIVILLGHLVALSLPKGLTWWNSVPVRLYILGITGLTLGLWACAGLLILLWRRLSEPRVRAVTTPMDIIVLVVILISVGTGLTASGFYRFGHFWFTGVFTPYLRSIFTLQPKPQLVANLPLLMKIHAFNFFVFLAIFPFSRLIHIITVPLGYLVRPWQIVIWARRSHALSGEKA
ncbi:MAG: respiratory nitrate reductase subunit gamma [Acidobacteria bacterium]|nr:respiratory nitrate reductase subunit gamma [Acidobacteriota bacterium]